MRGLWLGPGGPRLRTDLPWPRPRAGEALVDVVRAAVCGTDLELASGLYGFEGVPGHEFVAVVRSDPGGLAGARVVAAINSACGRCRRCRTGLAKHCEARTVVGIRGRHGCFAEQTVVPRANLHVVPDALDDDVAVFTEPLAAALDVLRVHRPATDDRALVVGAGRLGQLVARVLARHCRVDACTRAGHGARLLEGVAERTFDAAGLEERRYDLAVDCSGNADGLDIAVRAVRPQGTVVMKSTFGGEPAQVDPARLVVDEIRIAGSRCGPFDQALELLRTQAVDPLPLVEARYPLEEALSALEHAARPGAQKVVMDVAAP